MSVDISRTARCAGVRSASSTMPISRAPSRMTRPYPPGVSTSVVRIEAAAWVRWCTPRSRLTWRPSTSGSSPAITRISAIRPTASSADPTAWPVPSGWAWRTKTGSGSRPQDRTASSTRSAPSPTTTTSRPGRAAIAARATCHRAGRPSTGCSTLGSLDFNRLPLPAASRTAAREGTVFSGTDILRRSTPNPLYRGPYTLARPPLRGEVPGGGVEPPSRAPKARVLPLDHPGSRFPIIADGGGQRCPPFRGRSGRAGDPPRRGPPLGQRPCVGLVASQPHDRRSAPAHHGPQGSSVKHRGLGLGQVRVPCEHRSLQVVEQQRPERFGVAFCRGNEEWSRVGPRRRPVLIPPAVRIGRADAEVERAQDPPQPVHGGRIDHVTSPLHQHRAAGQHGRDVGPHPCGDVGERFHVQAAPPQLVQHSEGGRCVGAPATEPGGNRDPLLDLHLRSTRVLALVGNGERGDQGEVESAGRDRASEIVDALHGHPQLVGGTGRDPVRQRDRHDEALDVVVAVLPSSKDAEEHVDLGVRPALDGGAPGPRRTPSRRTASAILANSGSPSRSARVPGSTPLSERIRAAEGASRPRRRRALPIVFRRSAHPSSITRKSAARSAFTGAGRGVRRTVTDSTLGRGQKTSAGTRRTSSARARYASRTLAAPYASSPGWAVMRSPTSRCTITKYSVIRGPRSSMSSSSGTATLYGRFDTIVQSPAGSAASQSIFNASPTSSRTRG